MNILNTKKNKIACVFIVLLSASLNSYADIYKWVDKNGVTHYSLKNSVKDKTSKFKVRPQPTSVKTSAELFEENEQKRRRKINKENALKKTAKTPVKKKRPRPISEGREDGTDASRCVLARDILSGSLRHSNGMPVDAYDIKTAKNDVRKFCD